MVSPFSEQAACTESPGGGGPAGSGAGGIEAASSMGILSPALLRFSLQQRWFDPVERVLRVGRAAVYFQSEGFGAVQVEHDRLRENAGTDVLLLVDDLVVELDADGDIREVRVAFDGVERAEGGVLAVEGP